MATGDTSYLSKDFIDTCLYQLTPLYILLNKIKKKPKPNKQAAHLEQIRNTKKLNLDNKLNKNLEYASSEEDPDSDKEIDNDFIYATFWW